MEKQFAAALLAVGVLMAAPAQAHRGGSELSAISTLPLASIVVGTGAVASGAIAAPVMLSAAAGTIVVRAVDAGVRGTICVLERVSDGARVSVEIVGRGVGAAALAVGTVVTVSVVGAGVVLSAAGEAIAFLPNAAGNALMYNQRLTY